MNHRPSKPVDHYPVAEMPPPPPGDAPGAAAEEPAAAAASELRPAREGAVLRFLDPQARVATFPLSHPFELDGAEIRSITVRRLSVAEVAEVIEATPDGERYDLYAFYAVMTGLPAPVLRGLDDDDGGELLSAARPLLPRVVRDLFFSPTSERGGDTPSARPAG